MSRSSSSVNGKTTALQPAPSPPRATLMEAAKADGGRIHDGAERGAGDGHRAVRDESEEQAKGTRIAGQELVGERGRGLQDGRHEQDLVAQQAPRSEQARGRVEQRHAPRMPARE